MAFAALLSSWLAAASTRVSLQPAGLGSPRVDRLRRLSQTHDHLARRHDTTALLATEGINDYCEQPFVRDICLAAFCPAPMPDEPNAIDPNGTTVDVLVDPRVVGGQAAAAREEAMANGGPIQTAGGQQAGDGRATQSSVPQQQGGMADAARGTASATAGSFGSAAGAVAGAIGDAVGAVADAADAAADAVKDTILGEEQQQQGQAQAQAQSQQQPGTATRSGTANQEHHLVSLVQTTPAIPDECATCWCNCKEQYCWVRPIPKMEPPKPEIPKKQHARDCLSCQDDEDELLHGVLKPWVKFAQEFEGFLTDVFHAADHDHNGHISQTEGAHLLETLKQEVRGGDSSKAWFGVVSGLDKAMWKDSEAVFSKGYINRHDFIKWASRDLANDLYEKSASEIMAQRARFVEAVKRAPPDGPAESPKLAAGRGDGNMTVGTQLSSGIAVCCVCADCTALGMLSDAGDEAGCGQFCRFKASVGYHSYTGSFHRGECTGSEAVDCTPPLNSATNRTDNEGDDDAASAGGGASGSYMTESNGAVTMAGSPPRKIPDASRILGAKEAQAEAICCVCSDCSAVGLVKSPPEESACVQACQFAVGSSYRPYREDGMSSFHRGACDGGESEQCAKGSGASSSLAAPKQDGRLMQLLSISRLVNATDDQAIVNRSDAYPTTLRPSGIWPSSGPAANGTNQSQDIR